MLENDLRVVLPCHETLDMGAHGVQRPVWNTFGRTVEVVAHVARRYRLRGAEDVRFEQCIDVGGIGFRFLIGQIPGNVESVVFDIRRFAIFQAFQRFDVKVESNRGLMLRQWRRLGLNGQHGHDAHHEKKPVGRRSDRDHRLELAIVRLGQLLRVGIENLYEIE